MNDVCPLCWRLMDDHLILTKDVKVQHRSGLVPIGWLCPADSKAPVHNKILLNEVRHDTTNPQA